MIEIMQNGKPKHELDLDNELIQLRYTDPIVARAYEANKHDPGEFDELYCLKVAVVCLAQSNRIYKDHIVELLKRQPPIIPVGGLS